MHKNQKIGLLVTLVALAVWAGCGFSVKSIRSWMDTSTTTQGEVVSIREKGSYDSQERRTTYYYYPTVMFRTASGQQIMFESEVGTDPPAYQVGDSVDVRYQTIHPVDARIDQFFELWLVPLVMGFLGIFFTIPAFLLTFTKLGRQAAISRQANDQIKKPTPDLQHKAL